MSFSLHSLLLAPPPHPILLALSSPPRTKAHHRHKRAGSVFLAHHPNKNMNTHFLSVFLSDTHSVFFAHAHTHTHRITCSCSNTNTLATPTNKQTPTMSFSCARMQTHTRAFKHARTPWTHTVRTNNRNLYSNFASALGLPRDVHDQEPSAVHRLWKLRRGQFQFLQEKSLELGSAARALNQWDHQHPFVIPVLSLFLSFSLSLNPFLFLPLSLSESIPLLALPSTSPQ